MADGVRLAAISCCIVLACISRALSLPITVEPTTGEDWEKVVVFRLEKNWAWKKRPRNVESIGGTSLVVFSMQAATCIVSLSLMEESEKSASKHFPILCACILVRPL